MIEEAYVSFETAKLLKEKGFNEDCFRFYMPTGNGIWKYEHYHDFDISDRIECPTQQMAMKWLREVHDIFIKLEFDVDEDIQWHPSLALIKCNKYIHTNELQWYDTHEQAIEAALKYVLENLI